MNVEEFESIKDFQKGFLLLAEACEKKFSSKIRTVHISPSDSWVDIEFSTQ